MKKRIKLKELAQYKHIKSLIALEKQTSIAYRFCVRNLIEDIRKIFKKEKLAKSEDKIEGLEPGWTEEVASIEVNTETLVGNVIDKYLKGLRWVLLGDYAGEDASKAATSIGLKGKVVPGAIQSAYLMSLDAHSKHYEDVLNEDPPEIPKDLLKGSIEQIVKKINKLLDQTLNGLKTDLQVSIDKTVERQNFKTLNNAHEEAHERALNGESLSGETGDLLNLREMTKELERITEKFESKWDVTSHANISVASATGTHQALLEVYGSGDSDVRVAWVEMEDEKVCTFCKNASKNPDGSHKMYKITDFEPSGYNYGRKKADWKLTIPGAHPNCRCQLVYIPPGFEMDKFGGLVKI